MKFHVRIKDRKSFNIKLRLTPKKLGLASINPRTPQANRAQRQWNCDWRCLTLDQTSQIVSWATDLSFQILNFIVLNSLNNLIDPKTCHLTTHHHISLLTKFKLIINSQHHFINNYQNLIIFYNSNKTYIEMQSILVSFWNMMTTLSPLQVFYPIKKFKISFPYLIKSMNTYKKIQLLKR